MRRDNRDAHFIFAGLDLVNVHSIGKREQGIAFHHDLISLSTSSHTFLCSVSSLLPLPTTPPMTCFTKVGQEPQNGVIYTYASRGAWRKSQASLAEDHRQRSLQHLMMQEEYNEGLHGKK